MRSGDVETLAVWDSGINDEARWRREDWEYIGKRTPLVGLIPQPPTAVQICHMYS